MNKKTLGLSLLLLSLGLSVQAADITWTDLDADQDWGNTNNWSSFALPGAADKAIFPLAIDSVANYVVNMNGDRSVKEISFTGAGKPQIIGPANTLTVSGNILGGSSAVLSTKVVFTADATVKSTDSFGNKITLAGGVSSPYTVTYSGTVNNGIAVTSGVYSVSNSFIYPPTSFRDCQLTNSILTLINNWSDSNGNRTLLSLYSTVNLTDTPLVTEKNAGAVTFNNQGDIDRVIQTTVKKIHHKQGNLGLSQDFYGGTNLVTIQSFVCEPGAFVRVSNNKKGSATFNAGVNAGFIIAGATNVNSTYKPNFMYNYYLTKINAFGAIESCSASTDYSTLPVASYDPTKMYRLNTATDITLSQDSEVWALLVETATDRTLSLAEFDLTIGSGNLAIYGSGVKSITSSGGKLVFGGDDVILYASGSTGSLTFSAPIAWRKPAGSAVQYPSLIFSGTGLPEIIFSGADEIGDYYALNAEAGQSYSSIIFAGASDRHFHGPITGRNSIYNRGSGTLTFSGPDDRRSPNFYAESGTSVLAHASAAQPRGITNGAVCVIADGIAYTKAAVVYKDGTLCMEGNTASSTAEPTIENGACIEGGLPGAVGTFTTAGKLAPKANFTVGLKISNTTNSLIKVGTGFYNPAVSGMTMTVRVEDVSGGTASIGATNVFTILTAGSFNNTSYPLSFNVVNGSPTRLDTSAAQVSYNTSAKTITISGIRPAPRGTAILLL